MTQYSVEGRLYWIKSFPSNNEVFRMMIPATIVQGQTKPDINKEIISFGAYAMEYTKTTKNMKSRSVPNIENFE